MQAPWQAAAASGAQPTTPAHWQKVLVYGLGVSGLSATRWLRSREVEVVGIDRRPAPDVPLGALAGDDGLRLLAGSEPDRLPDELSWQAIDGVVVSPGVPTDRPLLEAARDAGVPVIAEVELAFPWLNGPVLGITGSNGKSTTTAMAGAMLEAAGLKTEICGNIGEPLTSKIPASDADSKGVGETVYVVELSSFQLESVDLFHPRAAALLNLAPDHLDRHPSYEHYRNAKLVIFRRQTAEDQMILNGDDDEVLEHTASLPGRRRLFSRSGPVVDGCALDGDRVMEFEPGREPVELFQASDVPLPGPHNLENAMAAALLARSREVAPEHIVEGLRRFQGLPHRLQRVRELDGAVWFDDSKGTNLAATARSLEGFDDGKVLLILGGIYKGGDLDELVTQVVRKARKVFLIGQAAETFEQALEGKLPAPDVIHCDVLANAVQSARREARPGESVLLSPACSSFDQFPNFAERGRIFQRLVRELPEGVSHGP